VKIGLHDTPPSAVASSSKQNDTGPPRTASAQVLRTQPAIGTTPGAAAEGKTEGDSSVTPDYTPAPSGCSKRPQHCSLHMLKLLRRYHSNAARM
jgi:hypothetical protein